MKFKGKDKIGKIELREPVDFMGGGDKQFILSVKLRVGKKCTYGSENYVLSINETAKKWIPFLLL